MKRRDFLLSSSSAALLGSVPVGAMAALRGSLLDDPTSWIGTTFRLPDGARLELARVEPVADDAHSLQLRLQFRTLAGTSPVDGTHVLDCAWGEQPLYLQQGREGPVACVNRLHGVA